MMNNEYAQDMTLRDWFAGQAIAGIVESDNMISELAVSRAYKLADAMMEAREKKEI